MIVTDDSGVKANKKGNQEENWAEKQKSGL